MWKRCGTRLTTLYITIRVHGLVPASETPGSEAYRLAHLTVSSTTPMSISQPTAQPMPASPMDIGVMTTPLAYTQLIDALRGCKIWLRLDLNHTSKHRTTFYSCSVYRYAHEQYTPLLYHTLLYSLYMLWWIPWIHPFWGGGCKGLVAPYLYLCTKWLIL